MMRHRIPGPPTHTIAKALVNKQVKQVHAQANMALIDESIANLVALEASLYRDDFAEFVRAAFHVVEPSERFVDGWHRRRGGALASLRDRPNQTPRDQHSTWVHEKHNLLGHVPGVGVDALR